MLASVSRSKTLFEFGNLRPIQTPPLTTPQSAQQTPFLGFTEHRPKGKRAGANWRSAQECKFLWHGRNESGSRRQTGVRTLSVLAQTLTQVDAAIPAGADAAQFAEPETPIETKCWNIGHAHPKVRARGIALAKPAHHCFQHAATIPAPLRARQKIDMQMRGVG